MITLRLRLVSGSIYNLHPQRSESGPSISQRHLSKMAVKRITKVCHKVLICYVCLFYTTNKNIHVKFLQYNDILKYCCLICTLYVTTQPNLWNLLILHFQYWLYSYICADVCVNLFLMGVLQYRSVFSRVTLLIVTSHSHDCYI